MLVGSGAREIQARLKSKWEQEPKSEGIQEIEISTLVSKNSEPLSVIGDENIIIGIGYT